METTENKTKTLAARLCAILSDVNAIPKNGRNEFHRYAYIKEEDVSASLRGLLAKHGVFIFASIQKVELAGERKTKSGAIEYVTRVSMKYTFMNADDQSDKFECDFCGDGIDSGDKGIYKALTGCHKYFLIRNFHLGSEDDPERENTKEAHRNETPAPVTQVKPIDPKKKATLDAIEAGTARTYNYELLRAEIVDERAREDLRDTMKLAGCVLSEDKKRILCSESIPALKSYLITEKPINTVQAEVVFGDDNIAEVEVVEPVKKVSKKDAEMRLEALKAKQAFAQEAA